MNKAIDSMVIGFVFACVITAVVLFVSLFRWAAGWIPIEEVGASILATFIISFLLGTFGEKLLG